MEDKEGIILLYFRDYTLVGIILLFIYYNIKVKKNDLIGQVQIKFSGNV